MEKEDLPEFTRDTLYKDGDLHYLYMGEIEDVFGVIEEWNRKTNRTLRQGKNLCPRSFCILKEKISPHPACTGAEYPI